MSHFPVCIHVFFQFPAPRRVRSLSEELAPNRALHVLDCLVPSNPDSNLRWHIHRAKVGYEVRLDSNAASHGALEIGVVFLFFADAIAMGRA